MNLLFLPNEMENNLIQVIQKYCRNEFALIRMTDTMLDKSIIDASHEIRSIFRDTNFVDYRTIKQGGEYKQFRPSFIISPIGIFGKAASFYRPPTKKGDPRFWLYGLNKYVNPFELVYFTVHESQLIAIPLVDYPKFEDNLIEFFGVNNEEEEIVLEVKKKIVAIKDKGWVESVSPNKLNDKDVGETLEHELGIKINNLKSADYKGEIEIKGKKLSKNKTDDTLFAMVPNWKISMVSSVKEVQLTYGYPDNEFDGYKALFVEVNNVPNPQGLYLEVDEENELLHQKHLSASGVITDVCSWEFETIKKRLFEKHPKTMWIVAESKKIQGKYHFKYIKVQYTHNPIFSQFISLIKQGKIVYNWRGRLKIDPYAADIKKSDLDFGHVFRLKPNYRHLLFGETIDIEL